ncbi:MAG: DUF2065 domain-containing protein [Mariprofundales bacterium]|nr:DUF2065 domain-containing protein [Mariprofundales bacterium]
MDDLWAALGLVLVLEGAIYALFPQRMIMIIQQISHIPPVSLRVMGLISVALGWLCVKLVRGG